MSVFLIIIQHKIYLIMSNNFACNKSVTGAIVMYTIFYTDSAWIFGFPAPLQVID